MVFFDLFTFTGAPPADTTVTAANRQLASHVDADSGVSPHVYAHSAYHPFERRAFLASAHDINYAFQWRQFGQCSFEIARNDPALTYSPGCLQRGAWIVIESASAKTWVGFIRELSESTNGMIAVEAVEVSALLAVKISRQQAQLSGASGWCFMQVMRAFNSRGHTGLFHPAEVEPGPRTTIDLAGQTAFDALNELSDRSGYEWWLDAVASPSSVYAQIRWGHRQGRDNANMIVLYEGTHFHELTYILDTSGMRQSVTVYGGVGELSSRTAITRSANYSPRANELGVALEPASELYNRALDVPPSLRSEDVLYRLMTSDRTELSMEAQNAMERGIGTSERYRAICTNAFSWRTIEVGDFIQIVTESTGLGAVNRKVRVTGMQPTPELGVMPLSVETPLK